MKPEERIRRAIRHLETQIKRLQRLKYAFEQDCFKNAEDEKNKLLDAFLGKEEKEEEYEPY